MTKPYQGGWDWERRVYIAEPEPGLRIELTLQETEEAGGEEAIDSLIRIKLAAAAIAMEAATKI